MDSFDRKSPRREHDAASIAHSDLGARGVLDPDIAEVLRLVERAKRPAYPDLGPTQARIEYEKASRVLDIRAQAVHRVDNVEIEHGALRVPVRIYWPREPDAWDRMPALVLAHGGGFTIGSIETVDAIARYVCNEVACCVISVDYRLSPEHKFPCAFDDGWAVVQWTFEQAATWGLDSARIAVGGESAGATISAACALAARDAGLPLALQWLVYPGTAARQDARSHLAYADGYLLSRRTMLWFFDQYLRDDRDRTDQRFAPLQARDVRGLARAWIAVAEFDPLVDEGVEYARRLQAAHVDAELAFYAGAVHGFIAMGGRVPLARRALSDGVQALRRAFAA